MENSNTGSASPQENQGAAETKVLPRPFDGYRMMGLGEIIEPGDMVIPYFQTEMQPSKAVGLKIDPADVGLYFRRIDPAPRAPAAPEGPHGICDDCGLKFHLPTVDDGSIVRCHGCNGESIREFGRSKPAPEGSSQKAPAPDFCLQCGPEGLCRACQDAYGDEVTALKAQPSTLSTQVAAARGALWNAFIAMGRAGANADLNHPMRKDWEDARAALALMDEKGGERG